MSWDKYWKVHSESESNLLRQVQRTSGNEALSLESIERYVDHLNHVIGFGPDDTLLDVCCGNGLVTSIMAAKCGYTTGVDFTKPLINVAKREFENDHLQFICYNALEIEQIIKHPVDKITLLFSFQYFNRKQGRILIQRLAELLKDGGKLILGDVPDRKYQHVLAGKGVSRIKYEIKYLMGMEPTGKFWSVEELDEICNKLNLKGTMIRQPENLPYAHYRFDYLVVKN